MNRCNGGEAETDSDSAESAQMGKDEKKSEGETEKKMERERGKEEERDGKRW